MPATLMPLTVSAEAQRLLRSEQPAPPHSRTGVALAASVRDRTAAVVCVCVCVRVTESDAWTLLELQITGAAARDSTDACPYTHMLRFVSHPRWSRILLATLLSATVQFLLAYVTTHFTISTTTTRILSNSCHILSSCTFTVGIHADSMTWRKTEQQNTRKWLDSLSRRSTSSIISIKCTSSFVQTD